MKKTILLFLILGLTFLASQAQNSTYSVIDDSFQQLSIAFAAGELTAHPVSVDGQTFTLLQMDGAMRSQKAGDANLPTYSTLIEVPLCQNITAEVSQAVFDTIALASLGADYPVLPLQPSRSKSDTAKYPLEWNKETYATNAYLGADLAMVERVGIARDRNLARLQISPIRYNAVEGNLIVCRQATVTVRYIGADSAATLEMFNLHHSPAFHLGNTLNSLYPKNVRTTAPVRYLIVAHSMFRNQLDDFAAWKRRKGFLTDIVYTDDTVIGSNLMVSPFLHNLYNNATAANPAPTYVLIVGDHEQIPAFSGTTGSHITDLPYMTWTTGDHIPDCYYGRFSAQDLSQLTPQIEKTLMYEQYAFANPSFLDRAVMVAGVDGGTSGDYGYTHADPAMDYAITHYVNGSNGFSSVRYYKNDTFIIPLASNLTVGSSAYSNSATVRADYNQGAGWINYTAHGSATSWGTPNFTTSHAAAMTNTQKFGLMIGNCCLTNKFETTTCLGEALLRKGNYCGAVGYIGGTNSTYWYEDFYWAVGIRNPNAIGPSMPMVYDSGNLGNYDANFHTHGEPRSQWVETQGAFVVNGDAIVESGTSSASMKYYYWEIYQLMGDPSVMPYRTQADSIVINAPSMLAAGTSSLSVHAVPYAYVAITDTLTHTLIDAQYADSLGNVTLTLPFDLPVDGYEIAASAQQYRTTFKPFSLIAPDGPFVVSVLPHVAITAGNDSWLSGMVVNLGNAWAHNVTVRFSCANPYATLLNDSLTLPTLPAGDTILFDSLLHIVVNPLMPDMATIAITTISTWDSADVVPSTTHNMVCHAPSIVISFDSLPTYVTPGSHHAINSHAVNLGHAPMTAAHLRFNSPIWQTHATSIDTAAFALAVGDTVECPFFLDIDNNIPINIEIPIQAIFDIPVNVHNHTASVIVGQPFTETFEGMVYHSAGWSHSTHPWAISYGESQNGFYSAQSFLNLGNNDSSVLTLTRTTTVDDSISFFYKVSSEQNYDKFHFFLDGTELITASGDVNWTRASYPISAGSHTFSFSYTKDVSLARGSDCAWIDDVCLPPALQPWIALYDTLCHGDTLIVLGDTANTFVPGTIHAVNTEADTILFLSYEVLPQNIVDTAVTACDGYVWHGIAYTESDTLADTIQSLGECPIYYQYRLTINHSSHDTLDASACDSLHLWSRTFTLSGSYDTTFVNAQGCDSLITLRLNVNRSTLDTLRVFAIRPPYQWNDQQYLSNGTYSQLFQTEEGCDSLVVLILSFTGHREGIDSCDSPAICCYPNPSNGTIRFSDEVSQAVIYDLMGRKAVVLRDTRSADLSALPDGIYTIEMTQSDGRIARARIVIAR